MLLGRGPECESLDRLIDAIRSGESRALVLRGEAGVGKTALLDYLLAHATGCRTVRVAAVESETELAFAALHQVCAPMLDRLGRLPDQQQEALRTVFGLQDGPAPDGFLVGLAVLSLLSEATAERPLVCAVDDAQWLDDASAQTLAVAARRLSAESVALVFAMRTPDDQMELPGLPELVIGGLDESAARSLLSSVFPAMLDERVRDRIVAETGGNPLAILELPRGLTPKELASGLVLAPARGLAGAIESNFARRFSQLPPSTRRLLLIASAEPLGDFALVFAVRTSDDQMELPGLPELVIGGLDESAARNLLRSVFPATLDERVRDRIVAETGGNPRAATRADAQGARKWPRGRPSPRTRRGDREQLR